MKTKTKFKLKEDINEVKICSCYDEDCKDVIDCTQCFLGFTYMGNIGIADGLCKESQNRKISK